jgi:hypothetical protein
LGKLFEKWISDANVAYNEFLSSQNLDPLRTIPGVVGQHYNQNARQHLKEATHPQLLACILSIDPRIKALEDLPFQHLTPDGVFSQGAHAAIFESKLTYPTYDAFPHDMAIYALAYEKESGKDVDYAIITHSDYPTGSQISDKLHQISDSVISQIITNLENFVRLIQFSSERRRTGIINQFRAKTHFYGSWKRFLERPPGLPPDFNRAVCPRCPFQARCYGEGAES